ncbi:MAG: recombination mediator RecR [Phycisphaerales bacterium]|nr:recombination mediator RecR [Phycisphaerales bacterium]
MSLRESPGTPEPIRRLLDALTSLPGIGRRSAERITFHLINASAEDAMALSRAIADTKQQVRCCSICSNIADDDPCSICEDDERDASSILVVEQPRDLIRLEATGMYRGVYHVLAGRLDPLGGVEPGDLAIEGLVARVEDSDRNARGVQVGELILGLNPTLEGDSTALYLADLFSGHGLTITRLARGLPSGSHIEFANPQVLSDAIEGRSGIRDDAV